jgi:hypothetical protein
MCEQSGLSPSRYVRQHRRAHDLIFTAGLVSPTRNQNYVGCLMESITRMSRSEAMESILLRPLDIYLFAGRGFRLKSILQRYHITTGRLAKITVGRPGPCSNH